MLVVVVRDSFHRKLQHLLCSSQNNCRQTNDVSGKAADFAFLCKCVVAGGSGGGWGAFLHVNSSDKYFSAGIKHFNKAVNKLLHSLQQ